MLALPLLFFAVQANAQNQFYVSPHVSTQGLGAEFKYSPQPAFNIRAGISALSLNFNTDYTVRSEPADLEVDVDMANAHLLFDWHPFVKSDGFGRKFLLTAGAAYFWKDQGDGVARYKGTYDYQGVPIPSGEVGELYGTAKWNSLAPYLGFGFENPTPKKRVNVGFALGAYYMGDPKVTVTGTKFLEDTSEDEREFRENISRFKFLPVLQVNLNIRLN